MIVAALLCVLLGVAPAAAQQGVLVYVPNQDTDNVSVFRTVANGTLETVATITAAGIGASSRVAVRGDQAFAYVTAEDTDKVHVINAATNTIVQTVDTGTNLGTLNDDPLGVTVSPDGTRVYVANSGSDTVSVFSAHATTGELTALTTITAGDLTRDVAVSPDGTRLYVANQSANSVQVFDTGSNDLVATVTVPGGLGAFNAPFDVAVNPAGTRVYVVNASGNTVSVVDTATNAVVATPATGASPRSVAVAPNGNHFYVVNQNDATISQFNAADNSLLATSADFSANPGSHAGTGAAISPDGNFLFATEFSNATNPDQLRMFSITNGILAFNGTPSLIAVGNEPTHPGICGNGNAMLASLATFVANTAGAFGCSGVSTPTFGGGTVVIGGSGLTFARAMTLGSGGRTINTNGNNTTVSGAIGGSGALTKSGAGILTLTGANNYTGVTTVSAGMLQAGAANTFSAGSTFSISAGAALNLDSFNQTIGGLAGAGDVMLGSATLTVGDSSSTTFSGSLSGTGGLTKVGSGTLNLTGSSTFGVTTINAGRLAVNGTLGSVVTVNAGGTLGGSGTISDTVTVGAGGILAPGNSIGTLSVNTLTLNAGSILDFEFGAPGNSDRVNVVGNLTLDGTINVIDAGGFGAGIYRIFNYGGTLTNNGLSIGTTPAGVSASSLMVQTSITNQINLINSTGVALSFWDGAGPAGDGVVNGGSGVWDAIGAAWTDSAGAATGTYASPSFAIFQGAPGTVTVAGGVAVTGMQFAVGNYRVEGDAITLADSATVVRVGNGTGTSAGMTATIASALTGTGGLVKTDAGTLVLTGANTYSGGTIINSGTLIGNSTSLQGNIFNNAALVFDQSFDGTYAGVIGGTGSLTKQGSGTVALGAANTYTGPTTIAAGTLRIGADGALGSTSQLTIESAGTLDLGGFSLGFGSVNGTGSVALGGGTFALGAADASTFAGRIVGRGTFVKSGSGTLTLTGASSHAGVTRVEGGTLRAGIANAFSAMSDLQVLSGGAVELAGHSQTVGSLSGSGSVDLGGATLTAGANGASTTFGGTISGSGSIAKTGAGVWTLTGSNAYTGLTIVNAGTLRVGAQGALGRTTGLVVQEAGTLDLNSFDHASATVGGTGRIELGSATLTLGGADSSSEAGVSISGSGRLVKSGTGVLELTGTNAYSGGTLVNAGTLVGNASSLQGAIQNNAVVGFNQAGNGTYAGVMSGSGSLIKAGAGALTLAGNNTYTGGTVVSAGSLIGTTRSLQGDTRVESALVFDQAFDGIFGGRLGGAGALTKSGTGALTLSGDHPFSGRATVDNGTLIVDGAFGGGVTVVNNGNFIGRGFLGGSLVAAGAATVGSAWFEAGELEVTPAATARPMWATAGADPQASIATLGQLTVAGDITLRPGTELAVAATNAGASTMLAATGTITAGGSVVTLDARGSYPRVMQTAIMSAANGILGQPTVRTNQASLDGFLTSDGRTMFLTVLNAAIPLASAAGSPNGAASATAFDRLRPGATGDLLSVTNELAALSDAALAPALEETSGEVHATALHLAAADGEASADLLRQEAMQRRLVPGAGGAEAAAATVDAPRTAWGAGRRWWGHLNGQRLTFDAASDAHAARGHVGGFTLGADWAPGRDWMLGAGGGYALGELNLGAVASTVSSTAPRAFGYAGYGRDRWTIHGGGSVARTSYRAERHMQFAATLDPRFGGQLLFGGVDRTAESESASLDTSAWVDAALTFINGGWAVQPGAGLRSARYGRGAWTESGAGALSLTGIDQAVMSTQADLNVRVSRTTGQWRPYASATYRRELGDGQTTTMMQLSGDALGEYAIHGAPFAVDRVIGAVGLSNGNRRGGGWSAGYRFDLADGDFRHTVDVGVRFY